MIVCGCCERERSFISRCVWVCGLYRGCVGYMKGVCRVYVLYI